MFDTGRPIHTVPKFLRNLQYSLVTTMSLLRYIRLLRSLANIPASGHCFGIATVTNSYFRYPTGIVISRQYGIKPIHTLDSVLSHSFFRHISVLSQSYLSPISVLSQSYLSPISVLSQSYLTPISLLSQSYHRPKKV
jgi:hypothetical protein